MKTNIIINFQLEGLHNWPDARLKLPEVAFLSDPHRHIFYFCCKQEVSHSDRDVEIILLKRKIIDYLYETFGVKEHPDSHYRWCSFGSMSCEMIAEQLLKKFDLNYCSVLEDNENGAECFYQPIVYNGEGGYA